MINSITASAERWDRTGIAMDRAGDIGLAYNISSSAIHPGISSTGRVPRDPPGFMETEVNLLTGGGSQLPGGKWSDNSAMRIDPADDCTFWYTTQYLKADGNLNWTAHIASFAFSKCDDSQPQPEQ